MQTKCFKISNSKTQKGRKKCKKGAKKRKLHQDCKIFFQRGRETLLQLHQEDISLCKVFSHCETQYIFGKSFATFHKKKQQHRGMKKRKIKNTSHQKQERTCIMALDLPSCTHLFLITQQLEKKNLSKNGVCNFRMSGNSAS